MGFGKIILSVCAAALICAAVRMLLPQDRNTGGIKLLLACFFTVTAVSALPLSGSTDLLQLIEASSEKSAGFVDYGGELRLMTAEETAGRLKDAIKEKLAAEGIKAEKIYIDVNISDSGRISISEVKLVFDRTGYELYSGRAALITGECTGSGTKVTCELSPAARQEG